MPKKDVFEDFGIRPFNSTPFNRGLDCNTKETKEERNLIFKDYVPPL